MTRLCGAKVSDFKKTLEKMREVYPFRDEETEIVNTYDYCSMQHNSLTIHTVDKTGVHVVMEASVDSSNT